MGEGVDLVGPVLLARDGEGRLSARVDGVEYVLVARRCSPEAAICGRCRGVGRNEVDPRHCISCGGTGRQRPTHPTTEETCTPSTSSSDSSSSSPLPESSSASAGADPRTTNPRPSWATGEPEDLARVAREFCDDWGLDNPTVRDDLVRLLEETRTIAFERQGMDKPATENPFRDLELRWADRIEALSKDGVPTENKFARNGAYASAAEQAAYRHGLEKAAWLLRNRPDEEGPELRACTDYPRSDLDQLVQASLALLVKLPDEQKQGPEYEAVCSLINTLGGEWTETAAPAETMNTEKRGSR